MVYTKLSDKKNTFCWTMHENFLIFWSIAMSVQYRAILRSNFQVQSSPTWVQDQIFQSAWYLCLPNSIFICQWKYETKSHIDDEVSQYFKTRYLSTTFSLRCTYINIIDRISPPSTWFVGVGDYQLLARKDQDPLKVDMFETMGRLRYLSSISYYHSLPP